MSTKPLGPYPTFDDDPAEWGLLPPVELTEEQAAEAAAEAAFGE